MYIELAPGQTFAETPKAWIIWQDESPHVIKRISKDRVFFAFPKDGWGWCFDCDQEVEVEGGLDAAGIYERCANCGTRMED